MQRFLSISLNRVILSEISLANFGQVLARCAFGRQQASTSRVDSLSAHHLLTLIEKHFFLLNIKQRVAQATY